MAVKSDGADRSLPACRGRGTRRRLAGLGAERHVEVVVAGETGLVDEIRPETAREVSRHCSIATALPVITACPAHADAAREAPVGPGRGHLPPAFTAAKSAWQSTSAFLICGPSTRSLRTSASC